MKLWKSDYTNGMGHEASAWFSSKEKADKHQREVLRGDSENRALGARAVDIAMTREGLIELLDRLTK